jgi:hypothetical protein
VVRRVLGALLLVLGLWATPAFAADIPAVGGLPAPTVGSGSISSGGVGVAGALTLPVNGGGNTGIAPAASSPTGGVDVNPCDAGTNVDTPAVAQCIAQQNNPTTNKNYYQHLIQQYANASCIAGVGIPNGTQTQPTGLDGMLNNLTNPRTMSGTSAEPYPLSKYGYEIGSWIAFTLMGFSMVLWFKNTYRDGATDMFRAIFATEAKFFGLGIVLLGMQFAAGEGVFASNNAPAIVKLGEFASAVGAGAARYLGVQGAGTQSFRIDTPGQAFQVSYCLALKIDAIPSLAALAKSEQLTAGRPPWDLLGKASDAISGAGSSIEVAIFSLVDFLLMLLIGLIIAVQLMLVKWGAIVIGGLGVIFLGFEMLERTRPLAEGYWKFVQGNVVGVLSISIVTVFIAALVDNVVQGIVGGLVTPVNLPLVASIPGISTIVSDVAVGSASMGALGKLFFVCMFALVLTIAIPRLTGSFLNGGAALVAGDLIAGVAGAGALAGGVIAGMMGAMRGLTTGLEKLRSGIAEMQNSQSKNAIADGQGTAKDDNQIGKVPEIADEGAEPQAAPEAADVQARTRRGSSGALVTAADAVAPLAHDEAAAPGAPAIEEMDPNAALAQASEEDEEVTRALEESVEAHAAPDAPKDAALAGASSKPVLGANAGSASSDASPTGEDSAAPTLPVSASTPSSEAAPPPAIDIVEAAAAGTVVEALQSGAQRKKGRRRKRSVGSTAAPVQQAQSASADAPAPSGSTRVDAPQAAAAAGASADNGAQSIAGTLRSSVSAVNEAGSQTTNAAQGGDLASLPAPLAAVAQANAELADTIQTVSALNADIGTAMTDLSKRQAVERASMRDGLRSLGRAANAVSPIAQLAKSNPALAPQAAAAAQAVASASTALATGGVTPAAAAQMGAATNSVASLAVAAQQAGAPASVVRDLANAATDLGVQYQVSEGVASAITGPAATGGGRGAPTTTVQSAAPPPPAVPATAAGSTPVAGIDMSPAQVTAFEALMERSFGVVAKSTDALAKTIASHAETLQEHGERLASPGQAQKRGDFYKTLLGMSPQLKRTAASILTDHHHSGPGLGQHKH